VEARVAAMVTTTAGRPTRLLDRTSALALGAHVVTWLFVLAVHPARAMAEDVARFVQIANAPGMIYRDVPVEYMPLEGLFVRLALHTSLGDAAVRVVAVSAVCDLVAFLVVARSFGTRAGAWYLWFALPLQVFMLFRLDGVAIVAVLGALDLCRRRRPGWAGTLFAAAVLLKLWPIVLVPVLLRKGGRRAVATAAAGVAVGVALWVAIGGVDAIRYVTSFRHATGWQVESTVGSFTALFTDALPRFELGAMRVGTIVPWATIILQVVAVATLVAVWWKARHANADPSGLPAAAAVATVIACSPVASAQYVAWLVPWCAVAVTERGRPVVLVATMGAATLAASSFLIYWDVWGGIRALEVISLARALCVVAIPVTWFIEHDRAAA